MSQESAVGEDEILSNVKILWLMYFHARGCKARTFYSSSHQHLLSSARKRSKTMEEISVCSNESRPKQSLSPACLSIDEQVSGLGLDFAAPHARTYSNQHAVCTQANRDADSCKSTETNSHILQELVAQGCGEIDEDEDNDENVDCTFMRSQESRHDA